ncbi:MAG: SDR family oxidoreductase [Planctomycetota bacterium]
MNTTHTTPQTFTDRVAVVTGAGGTLCSPIAADLAARGAKVALVGRSRERLEPVADAIAQAGGHTLITPADVTDPDQLAAAHDAIERHLGPCSLLVNGAGGNQASAVTQPTRFDPAELSDDIGGFFNLDLDAFGDVLTANTMGTVLPCRVFGRDLVKTGRGAVLNFTSMNAYRPLTRVAAYAMAKAAIANFTQWLAVYLAPANVRVNAIAPGFFVNDRSRRILYTDTGDLAPRGEQVMDHTPLGRFGRAEELLGCARWLLDDDQSAFVTGQTVPVDGGFLASAGV